MDNNNLKLKARKIRKTIIEMIGYDEKGHFGGSCSLADIAAVLYFDQMKHDAKNPNWEHRDKLILSKGHGALVQYAALGLCGYFNEKEFKNLKELGSILQGHPDMQKVPGIEANTGSLGQGLSIACGMAAALKIDEIDSDVYCIVGDGEMQEGQIYEAMMSAKVYNLDNLIMILDSNKLQASSVISEAFNHYPLKEKIQSFGFYIIEIDGHDIGEIKKAIIKAKSHKGSPVCIIANTIKGKGISCAEGIVSFHNGILNRQQYDKVIADYQN